MMGRLRITALDPNNCKATHGQCYAPARPAIPYKVPDLRAEVRAALKRREATIPAKVWVGNSEGLAPEWATRADVLYGWSKPARCVRGMSDKVQRAELARHVKRWRDHESLTREDRGVWA